MSIKRTGCLARLTVDNSFLFLFVISVGCPRDVLFQAVRQRAFATALAAENAQFEALSNRLIDLLLLKELMDEGQNVDQAEIRLSVERSERLSDGIVTHLQFAIVDHLGAELLQTIRWNRVDLVIREIEFASDSKQILVELDQLIEREIDGEDQCGALVGVGEGRELPNGVVTQVQHVECVDQEQVDGERGELIVGEIHNFQLLQLVEIAGKLSQVVMRHVHGFQLRHQLEVDVIQRMQLVVVENENLQLAKGGEVRVDRSEKIVFGVEAKEVRKSADARR